MHKIHKLIKENKNHDVPILSGTIHKNEPNLLAYNNMFCPYLVKSFITVAAMATNNPFMGDVMFGAGGGQVAGAEAGDQSQYYGRGYSQAQSGYSSSGLGY